MASTSPLDTVSARLSDIERLNLLLAWTTALQICTSARVAELIAKVECEMDCVQPEEPEASDPIASHAAGKVESNTQQACDHAGHGDAKETVTLFVGTSLSPTPAEKNTATTGYRVPSDTQVVEDTEVCAKDTSPIADAATAVDASSPKGGDVDASTSHDDSILCTLEQQMKNITISSPVDLSQDRGTGITMPEIQHFYRTCDTSPSKAPSETSALSFLLSEETISAGSEISFSYKDADLPCTRCSTPVSSPSSSPPGSPASFYDYITPPTSPLGSSFSVTGSDLPSVPSPDFSALAQRFAQEPQYLYRVHHSDAITQYSPLNGFAAGFYTPLQRPNYPGFLMAARAHLHLPPSPITSPFISTTPDLLSAISIAQRYERENKSEIAIVAIDQRRLPADTFWNAHLLVNDIRKKSEVLVWQSIPSDAIVGVINWQELRRTDGLGRSMPEVFRVNTPGVPVEKIRSGIDARKTAAEQSTNMAMLVVEELGMKADTEWAVFLTGVLIGWWYGEREGAVNDAATKWASTLSSEDAVDSVWRALLEAEKGLKEQASRDQEGYDDTELWREMYSDTFIPLSLPMELGKAHTGIEPTDENPPIVIFIEILQVATSISTDI